MSSDRSSYPRLSLAAGNRTCWALVAVSALAIWLPGCGPGDKAKLDTARTLAGAENTDLIAVDQRQPWLLAIACPLVSRLRHDGQFPWLLAISTPPSGEAVRLVDRLAARRMLILAGQQRPELQRAFGDRPVDLLDLGIRPMPASLQLARRFWRKSEEVVAAAIDEPRAVLWAALLAARRDHAHRSARGGEPLLIYDPRDPDLALLEQTLKQLHVQRVVVVGRKERTFWPDSTPATVERLDPGELPWQIIGDAHTSYPGTIVVARIPDETDGAGNTAWLAPYVSLVRGAPLVLCDSPSADEVERSVAKLIREHGLQSRSVTILADYRSIGTHPIPVASDDDPAEARYTVHAEPCMPKSFERLVSVGVGRIPLSSLQEASTFYLRGLARERLLAAKRPPQHDRDPRSCAANADGFDSGSKEPRALMISNPALNNMDLPLCEAVSRLTVAELRNVGVHVDEYYRQPGDSPEIMDRADEANVIIYEGHTEHDGLLRNPAYDYPGDWVAGSGGTAPLRRFDGLPVVVLQTCDSLQHEMLLRVYGAGGIALLGSSTPIHSASGSGFAKAVYDAALYRNATLGEALRDAQNYFFCLQDLKDLRHHRERAKSQRVALSFRLWGDPELRMFPQSLGRPRLAPVAAHWQTPGQVVVEMPGQRFAEVRNEAYVADFFPGSEAAGLVLRGGDGAARRIAPVYFFRLPSPGPMRVDAPAALSAVGDLSDRAVFRLDPAGRFLYVLYFPEKETAHGVVPLPYIEKPPAEGLRSQPARNVTW